MNTGYQNCSKRNRITVRRSRVTYLAFWGLVVIGLLGFSVLAFKFWPFTMDDSYITFRYAKNFAAGNGLVFNTAEQPRAEGITSPLYAMLLSLTPTGADLPTVSKCVGILSAGLAAFWVGAIIFRIAQCLTSLESSSLMVFSVAGACYYMLNPYFVANAVSGMETSLSGLAFAVFLFCLLQVSLPGEEPTYFWIVITGSISTVVPMLRPEMGLFVVVSIMALAFLTPDRRRSAHIILLIFIGLGTLYFIVRFIYYQNMLPLPFYIKQGNFGLRGWPEVRNYLDSNLFLLLSVFICLVFALAPDTRTRQLINTFVIGCIVAVACQLVYYSTIRHIMGWGFRFFQPVSTGLVIMGFVGVARVYSFFNESRCRDLIPLPVVFTGLFTLLLLSNVSAYGKAHDLFVDSDAKGYGEKAIKDWQLIIDASKGMSLHVAMNDCGQFPYYTGFRTVDLAGLNNRAIAKGRSPEATLHELREKNPSLVILCGSDNNNIASVFGWEKLSSSDVLSLGYDYVGSIKVGKFTSKEDYYWLIFTKSDQATDDFLNRLARIGVFVYANSSARIEKQRG
ncbi:hypothetical protein [Desulfosarcina ovata]|uniref:hypothetical protein n=1 Tax=Desulfosarcina ovata TaxID=83564 RepID=UPI0012D2A3EA|nr:hypothetical protein [Desulfosarcina ovata]